MLRIILKSYQKVYVKYMKFNNKLHNITRIVRTIGRKEFKFQRLN